MRVLQNVRHDEETNEEVRTPMVDPEEIHEVNAKAWQDIQEVGQGGGTDVAEI